MQRSVSPALQSIFGFRFSVLRFFSPQVSSLACGFYFILVSFGFGLLWFVSLRDFAAGSVRVAFSINAFAFGTLRGRHSVCLSVSRVCIS